MARRTKRSAAVFHEIPDNDEDKFCAMLDRLVHKFGNYFKGEDPRDIMMAASIIIIRTAHSNYAPEHADKCLSLVMQGMNSLNQRYLALARVKARLGAKGERRDRDVKGKGKKEANERDGREVDPDHRSNRKIGRQS